MATDARCYIPSFKATGLVVLEKKIKVFTIYGHGGIFSQVTRTKYIKFLPFAKRLHKKFK